MRLASMTRAAGIAAATALFVVGAVPQAQASPSAGYIGDGYANNSHGVWCVQHLLNTAGRGADIPEDAVWGPLTKQNVKAFQSAYGLTVDGIVGKATGQKLLDKGDPYYGGHNYCYWYLPSY
ncbi:peptidoglycan-binding protein [Streptomyces sp. NPDC093984]|uniref:peptidoglycan-binding domain-containing protein n=1 Tax=Streptomyces sp. NPDC093984 TaxID=3366052 RepID=UPI0038116EE1